MKVWVTQGEHFSNPGTPLTVHASEKSANEEAASLVAIIRKDYIDRWNAVLDAYERVGLVHEEDKAPEIAEPTPKTWQAVLDAMQAYEDKITNEDDRYQLKDLVWITEHEVKGFLEWIDSPEEKA